MRELELLVTGAVQGVGFRPLVYRLAHRLGIGGAVWNEPRGVRIRLVGPEKQVESFMPALRASVQAPARIDHVRILSVGETECFEPFRILESDTSGTREAQVLPDIATCPACLRELFDPRNRRFRHPFINCTHCGPRFSIVTGIPYDRARTTMARFTMCEACRAEFENPLDRRFHAQPIACPNCGPRVELWDGRGRIICDRDAAVRAAARAIREGKIVAVKGIGGFHLMCDARRAETVRELRQRKRREEKPFALMVPDLQWANALAEIGEQEEILLRSPAAPILLVRRRPTADIARQVAPGNPYLGLMLPYAPLHHLLLRDIAAPIVATSGNLSDEPICTDEREALERLAGIADLFLIHNRPIARPQDDSVVQLIEGRTCLIRRARGYAPLAIPLGIETPPLIALGPHLKNTVALAFGDRAVLSQHHGDLDTLESRRSFEQAVSDLPNLFEVKPTIWVVDDHPDYASTLYARDAGLETISVQHHHAHIAAVIAEHGLRGPVLGVAWDGTGLGPDRTIWGGEFLRVEGDSFLRIGRLSGFRLPGGDASMRKPLYAAYGAVKACAPELLPTYATESLGMTAEEVRACETLLANPQTAPFVSSAGRWFDVVAALLGLCRRASFEGQAAQQVEFAAEGAEATEPLPFEIARVEELVIFDFKPLLRAVSDESLRGGSAASVAFRFHLTLVECVAHMAGLHRGLPVALSGGCFQNRLLLRLTIRRLREAGHAVYWPEMVPANDGGISLGQAFIAAYRLKKSS